MTRLTARKTPQHYRQKVMDLKPSNYMPDELIEWLDECDRTILFDIVAGHELSAEEAEFYGAFKGHTYDKETETFMLVPPPYDRLYQFYLEMKIDYYNLEIDKYNNSAMLYNEARNDYAKYFNRTHMPVSKQTHWAINGTKQSAIPSDLNPFEV